MSEADPGAAYGVRWRRPTSLLRLAPRGLLVSLVVLTGAAWALTLYHTLSMSMPMGIVVRGGMAGEGLGAMAMGGMSGAGWSLGGAVVFVAVWTVMMAAMMLPAAAPMIVIFASAHARRARASAVPTWIFVAGYLLVWLAAGLLVYVLVQIGSEIVTGLTSADRASWGSVALGTTLAAAGLYQFTPIKRVCLTHCRSPFAFVARHWRDGRAGALQMGLRHGGYCLGCCWALFAVMVAAGGDELGLDAPAHAGCLRRESAAAGSACLTRDRCRTDRSRADRRKWRRLDALDRVIDRFQRAAAASRCGPSPAMRLDIARAAASRVMLA